MRLEQNIPPALPLQHPLALSLQLPQSRLSILLDQAQPAALIPWQAQEQDLAKMIAMWTKMDGVQMRRR
jgi:hypothetical protein